MQEFVFGFARRTAYFVDSQPMLAVFLGGALITVFLSAYAARKRDYQGDRQRTLAWVLYEQCSRVGWAMLVVSVLIATVVLMRTYLRHATTGFQRTHGRITEANYNAVQTIWGAEQVQGELELDLYWEEEITERIESEDVSKPAILRKRIVRHNTTANPFVSARHDVTLKQNPRKKGSALYGGYESHCRFTWQVRNPEARPMRGVLRFPLPAASAMYDDLFATLNGRDILPEMQLKDGALLLTREVEPQEEMALAIGFKSRGMSYWYFQVREAREIRDFTLTLTLPDLPKEKLNYPEGCMTPTRLETPDPVSTVLTYRLDHAISSKGMGIELPRLPQPGETTSAVLNNTEEAWLLTFSLLVFSFTLVGVGQNVLLSVMFGVGIGFAYALLGDFSDVLFGFWGTAGLIVLPLLLSVAWLTTRFLPGIAGKLVAAQIVVFGVLYPILAGLDPSRQVLYFNVSGLVLLAFVASQVIRRGGVEGRGLPMIAQTVDA